MCFRFPYVRAQEAHKVPESKCVIISFSFFFFYIFVVREACTTIIFSVRGEAKTCKLR